MERVYVIGDMFEGLEGFFDALRAQARFVSYTPGGVILHAGEKVPGFFVTLSGLVESSYTSERGRKKVLNIHYGRMMIGASSIDGEPSVLEYRCLTRVEAAFLPARSIDGWDCPMLLDFAKLQTYKSRMVSRQIEFSRNHDSAEKAERLIREFWAETGRGIPRRLVADVLGMSAVRLSHIIRSLEESGAISPGKTLLYPAGGEGAAL